MSAYKITEHKYDMVVVGAGGAGLRATFGLAFLFLWSWSFAYHLCNGIRHIVQDFGHGYSIPAFVRSSWVSVVASLFVTGMIWGFVLAGGGV